MPTYVYECASCGQFEQQQAIADPAIERCPTCGGPVARLLVGGLTFTSKGRATCSPAAAGGG